MTRMTDTRPSAFFASRSSGRLAWLRTAGTVLVASVALQGCEAKLAEFFAPAPEGPGAPTTGSISGTVTSSGLPLEDVRVDVSGVTSAFTFTDETGTYTIDLLDPGPYTLTFSEFPADVVCDETTSAVDVSAGATAVTDLGCTDTGGIQGTVTLNGDPYEGLEMSAFNLDLSFSGTVEASGQYSIEDVPVGEYVVGPTQLPPGVLCPDDQGLDVEAGQTVQADFACVTVPPSADEVAGMTDVTLHLTASTCAGDVPGMIMAPATIVTMDNGLTVDMSFTFDDNPAPNVGTYDPTTGNYSGVMEWVEAGPGVEARETIMLTFMFDSMGDVVYSGGSEVDFRDDVTLSPICDRMIELSGTVN